MKLEKIFESSEFTAWCTFEGKCECLYDEDGNYDGKPAVEDCIPNCSACLIEDKVQTT